MTLPRLARAAPYAALLALAGWLYSVAAQIEYVGPAERIGPDFWPRAILVLLGLLCAYEVVKNLFVAGSDSVSGMLQSLMQEAADSVDPGAGSALPAPSPARLAIGIGTTLAYVLLVDALGFFLATSGFLFAFVMVGGYRRWGVALAVGVAGSFVMLALFMKIVYVSLPLGAGPFRAVSLALLGVLGVR